VAASHGAGKIEATAHQSYNTRKRNTCKQANGLLDGALDLLAQGFGLCILVPLRLRLFGCVNCSSPLNILLPCCPYYEMLVRAHCDGRMTWKDLLGLSLLEYSFNRPTKLSKSSCFSWRLSRDLFWSSGLYRCRQRLVSWFEMMGLSRVGSAY
jgi:hypothetical protein